MGRSRRKYKRSRPKVQVGLPKKKPNVFKPSFNLPPKLRSLIEEQSELSSSAPKWDEKATVIQNYKSFGVVSNPNLLSVRSRTSHIIESDSLQVPHHPHTSSDEDADQLSDSGSELEEDDMDYFGVDCSGMFADVDIEKRAPEPSQAEVRVEVGDDIVRHSAGVIVSPIVPSSSHTKSDPQLSKKRKMKAVQFEERTSPVRVLDPESLELSDIYLKDVKYVNTPVTYFNEGIFGRKDLQLDLYQHFGSEEERARVQTACKEEGLTYEEMVAHRLFEALSIIREGERTNRAYRQRAHEAESLLSKYEQAINRKDATIGCLRLKINDLGTELVDRSEKLKNAENVAMEQITRADKTEEELRVLKEETKRIQDEVNSLRDLVTKLKEDCVRGYREGVSWVMASLKTQASRLNLTGSFTSLVRAMQSNESSSKPTSLPLQSTTGVQEEDMALSRQK